MKPVDRSCDSGEGDEDSGDSEGDDDGLDESDVEINGVGDSSA